MNGVDEEGNAAEQDRVSRIIPQLFEFRGLFLDDSSCNHGHQRLDVFNLVDRDRKIIAIQHENISGCQFHPEKSGPTGLAIIRNFLAA